MKNRIILVLSILCGISAMFMTKFYLSSAERKLRAQFQMVQVVGVSSSLPAGTVLTSAMLGQMQISKGAFSTRNIVPNQYSMILGRKLKNSMQMNTPLLWSDIEGDEKKGGNLAQMVNQNERAVSIPVDQTSSVTGLVEPNDHVDILGTFTFPSVKGDPQQDTVTLTILQNVTVLAVGRDTAQGLAEAGLVGSGPRKNASYSTVTLLVSPKEAEMLVFALQKGRLTLTLRNPSDVSSADDLGNINFNYLEKKVGEFNDARQKRLKGNAGGDRR